MATLRAAKQTLRLDLKKRVSALSEAEKRSQTLAVTRQLFVHPKYQNAERIAVFLSLPDEIQTEDVIEDIFQRGKQCFIPRYKSRSNHMDMVKLTSAEEIQNLPLTSWNIRQPANEDNSWQEALASGGLDLILMPGLGFDKQGNRLGRGKGYYDTYLARCLQHPKGKPFTIALAFREQVCELVPVAENDIQIDELLYAIQ
ncbi:5,10-methenyltetrahydrofolate synthetase (5-formyltetrahydrofolate cyclo-ligase) [Callorhinchus milii]|nr:5,10-methenyltetrahydrofolate synthetase (5-formyltetrahydrofolate cyclo-ligase) [Callorhinchus milii]|eukprot:gi/632938561/ref/XP_007905466.1/ PREDICTED: 5-formyltetrahydrofolate cyclo-ligase [Callorhinchus milii]